MPLDQPTNVKCELDGQTNPSVTAVVVTWDNILGAVCVLVQRSDDGGSTYNAGTVVTEGHPFRDTTGLTSGNDYWYKVTAVLSIPGDAPIPNSPSSDPAPLHYIDAPASVTGTPSEAESLTIDVSWPDVGTDRYQLERTPATSDTFDAFSLISLTVPDNTSYDDDLSKESGNEFVYAVTARNAYGSTRRRKSDPVPLPPAFAATIDPNVPTSVILTWDDTGYVDLDHFEMDRAVDGLTWSRFQSSLTGSTYTDTGADLGHLYYYRIRAVTASGAESGWSGPVSAQPMDAPASVTVEAVEAVAILITWPSVTGATFYRITRQRGTHGPAIIAEGVTGTQYLDSASTGLQLGQEYTYFVTPGNQNGYGTATQSPWVATSPAQFKGAIGAALLTNFSLGLTWEAPSYTGDHVSNLLIEKSEDQGDNWTTVDTVAISAISYNTVVPGNTSLLYRLSAVLSPPDVSSAPVLAIVTSVAGDCTGDLDLSTAAAVVRSTSAVMGGSTLTPGISGGTIRQQVGVDHSGEGLFQRNTFNQSVQDRTIEAPLYERDLSPSNFGGGSRRTFDPAGGEGTFLTPREQPGGQNPLWDGGPLAVDPTVLPEELPIQAGQGQWFYRGPSQVFKDTAFALIPALLPQYVYIHDHTSRNRGAAATELDYYPYCPGFPFPAGAQYAGQSWYIVRKQTVYEIDVFGTPASTPTVTYEYTHMGLVSPNGNINPEFHLGVDYVFAAREYSQGFSTPYAAGTITYYPVVTCHRSTPPPSDPLTSRKAVSAYENGQKASPATGFVLVETAPRVIDVGLAAPQLGNLTLHKGQGWRIVDHGGAIISVDGAMSGDVDADGVCLDLPASVTIHNYEAQADVGQPHVSSVEFAFTVEISSCTDWPSVTQADVFDHGSNWANWWWDYFYNFTPSQSAKYYTHFPEHACG